MYLERLHTSRTDAGDARSNRKQQEVAAVYPPTTNLSLFFRVLVGIKDEDLLQILFEDVHDELHAHLRD